MRFRVLCTAGGCYGPYRGFTDRAEAERLRDRVQAREREIRIVVVETDGGEMEGNERCQPSRQG